MLLHGGLVDRRSWAHQLELAEGHQLLLPDTRGFGASWPMEAPASIEQLVDDVAGAIDDAGVDRVHLLGFSIGGMIAAAVALRRPERLSSLVLESTTAARSVAHTRSVPPVEPSAHVRRAFSAAFRDAHPDFMTDYVAMARENHARGSMPALAACVAHAPTLSALAELCIPTLVVHARDDAAIPYRAGEGLAATIPGARLVSFDGCGHTIHIEKPSKFNRTLVDFVDEHEASNGIPRRRQHGGKMHDRPTDDAVLNVFDDVLVDHDNIEHYRARLEHRLLIARCADCGHWQHPPRAVCAQCWSSEMLPTEVSGDGVVELATVLHLGSAVAGVDYVSGHPIGAVALSDAPGVRFTATLVGDADHRPAIGDAVELCWLERAGRPVPAFRPREAS